MKKVRAGCCTVCTSYIALILVCFVLGSIFIKNHSVGTWFGVGVFSAFIMLVSYKGIGKENFFDHIYRYCLLVFLIVTGIFQITKINELRFTPSFDLDAIYGGAISWVETGDFSGYYDYFDWFPNNLGGLCFFYLIFKVGSFFGTDYFAMAAGVNEIILLSTFALTSLTVKKLWGSKCGILTLILIICVQPLMFMTDAFYTDSLSMLFPIGLFYLSLKIEECDGRRLAELCIFSGVVTAVGSLMKPTVLIMAVAISLTFLLRKKWKKLGFYIVAVGSLYLILTMAFRGFLYGNYLDPELAKVKNTPPYHWVMMGLEGDGGYNPQDYEFTRSFTDPGERDEALKDEIANRISQKGITGMFALYSAKLFRCLGDGTLGVSDFLDDNPHKDSLLHEYLLYGGRRYAVYQAVCNIVFYTILLFLFAYLLIGIGKNRRGLGEVLCHNLELAPILGISGIIVFLMHWETSPRYITNYVPVMIGLAAGGIKYLEERLVEKGIDNKVKAITDKYSEEIKIFVAAIGFRMVMYLISVCVMAIMGDYPNGISFPDFLEAWKRWDSAHYLNIAENGYAGAIENGEHIFLVFYPLYPWLIKTLSIFIKDLRLCGIIISTISYGIGSIFLYKIAQKESGEEAAKNTLILISVFPFAFFFGSIATESLFLAIAAAFFYYLRKHDWMKVSFFGFLACLTKVQGLLLAFSVLVELLYFKRGIKLIKEKKWKSFFKRIIYPGCIAAMMLFGLVIYLVINYVVEGDPFRFMYYQRNHWGNGLCFLWETIGYVKDNALRNWDTSVGMSLWLPELVLFAVYILAIVYGFVRKLRPMYMVYLIAFFLLTYSSTWLISGGRYTLSALPVFMLAGDCTARHEKWKLPSMLFSAMLMIVYMIGYYSWKQIM